MVLNSWQKFLKQHKGVGLNQQQLKDLYRLHTSKTKRYKKTHQLGGKRSDVDEAGIRYHILPEGTLLYMGTRRPERRCPDPRKTHAGGPRSTFWLSDLVKVAKGYGGNCCIYRTTRPLKLIRMDWYPNIIKLGQMGVPVEYGFFPTIPDRGPPHTPLVPYPPPGGGYVIRDSIHDDDIKILGVIAKKFYGVDGWIHGPLPKSGIYTPGLWMSKKPWKGQLFPQEIALISPNYSLKYAGKC